MPKNVIIVGAGGHARVIADTIEKSGDVVLGFLDDKEPLELVDINVLGKINTLLRYQNDAEFVVGIGSCSVREQIMGRFNVPWYTAIHPSAVIGGAVQIGVGTVVMGNAVINNGTEIGRGCIINTGATVDHDNHIGAYTHISVGAHTAGNVTIGERTWVGIGAVISNDVSICGGCILGAGTVVIRDITQPGTYVGAPARRINEDTNPH